MKFSVIVPAFNLEKHIRKCLDSLLDQNLKNSEYEILIINDGSTDHTSSIVIDYTEKYSNVFLYNKENAGVSSARNFGINVAKGEYILFVDGDDWLCHAVMDKIYLDLKTNNLEIARFGYYSIFKDAGDVESSILKKNHLPITGIEFITKSKTKEFYPWLYIISRAFLLKNKLLFNTSLSFCEDKEFMLRALFYATKFQNFDYIHYNYNLKRDGSATSTYSDKNLNDSIKSSVLTYQFSKTITTDEQFQNYLKSFSVRSLEKSYYKLTVHSLWGKFWVWKQSIKNNNVHKILTYKDSFKLFVLSVNSLAFYFIYFLPRAVYHKLKRTIIFKN